MLHCNPNQYGIEFRGILKILFYYIGSGKEIGTNIPKYPPKLLYLRVSKNDFIYSCLTIFPV